MQDKTPIAGDCCSAPMLVTGVAGSREKGLDQGIFGNVGADKVKEYSVRGGLISVSSQGLRFMLQMGAVVILARLLSPADYGLQGMVLAMMGFLGLFRDAGLSMATVQREVVSHVQISAAFWMNVGFGIALTVLSLLLAPAMAAFYREPKVFWVAVVSGTSFLITGLGVQHRALLQRSMRFMTMAKIDVISLVTSSAVGIGMAALGCGYWSLVGMGITGPAISAAGAWLSVPWVPGMLRRNSGVRAMLRFGGAVTLTNLLVYLGNNAEKMLLGRFWGAEVLGLYGRAYSLVNLPTTQMNTSIFSVALPALSRLQSDPKRLISAFLKGYSVVISVTVPATICCVVFAEEIIRIMLGPNWSAAAPLLRLLGPTILVFAFCHPLGWFLTAIGRPERALKISFLAVPFVILAIVIALPYGPKGVALGYSLAWIVLAIPVVKWTVKGTGVSLGDCWRAARPAIVSGAVAGACGLAFKIVCDGALPAIPCLVLGTGLSLGIYAWILLAVMGQKGLFGDLLKQMRQRYPR